MSSEASRITSIRTRILAAAVGGAALATFMVAAFVVGTIAISVRVHLHDIEALVGPEALERCAADPSHFVFEGESYRIWAFDSLGHSMNSSAPGLPDGMLAHATRGSSYQLTPNGPYWRRTAIQRVADSGPCAVLLAVPPQTNRIIPLVRLSTLIGGILGLSGALMATLLLAVRPLVDRLARLDAAARGVGSDGFHSAHDIGDDELGRISNTLDTAHDRIVADRAERMRRHRALEYHLATVAHDLRTPLSSLQLMLEDLGGHQASLAPAARETLRDARFEVAYLEALADNLHQATRMTGGLDASEGEADLQQIVARVEARFAILGRILGATVAAARPDTSVWVRCRPALAERAIANLVHNGVIHGSGDVGIVLGAYADRFSLTVRSAGPTLDPAVAEALARRRLGNPTDPSRSRGVESSRGLGVAIVNAVVESAGFTVRYDAPPDGGLAVTLEGPRRPR